MSKFITFNGVDFFNSEKIEKISVLLHEKKIKDNDQNKDYLYCTVEINGVLAFRSDDFKIYDDGFKTPKGMELFDKEMQRLLGKIDAN